MALFMTAGGASCNYVPKPEKRVSREEALKGGSPFSGISPSLSPDSTKIVFAARGGGRGDIFIYDVNTGRIKKVTSNQRYNYSPCWHPDGNQVFYISEENENAQIHVISLDTLKDEQFTVDKIHAIGVGSPSPDGSKILIVTDGSRWGSSRNRIYVVNITSKSLTECEPQGLYPSPLQWADEDTYYYMSLNPGKSTLYSMKWKQGVSREIHVFNWGPDDCIMLVVIDPHTKTIAYVRRVFRPKVSDTLFVMDVDGGNKRKLLESHSIDEIQFSADGTKIVLLKDTNSAGDGDICILDVVAGNLRTHCHSADAGK